MKKLHLDLASLCVESFEPAAEDAPSRGTVAARAITAQTCRQFTCGHTCDVNDLSCNNQNTCYGPQCPASLYPTCVPVCVTGEIC
jgi:hypothetical protein